MNGTHRDQALTAALAHSLGHAAPFSESECRDVTALALTHCHEISDLAWCPNLRSLEISNSDIHDLRFVEALPHLETLKIYGAPVSDVQPITHCPQLTRLDLCFTLVADLTPALQLPRLTSGVILGNPWSLSTRQTIIPELLNLIPGKQRPRAFMFSSETDWRNTLTLQSYGLPLCQSTLTFNASRYDEFANAGASMRPVTIAEGTEGSTSGLAIDAASARTAIYSYDREMDAEYEELDAGLDVAFTSYAKMLAGLRVMRIVCGEKTWKIKAKAV